MTLYSRLGLSESASEADIERSYRRLARRYHPGVNPGDRVAEQVFQQIQEAYQVLVDAERRRDYDRGGRAPDRQDDPALAFEGFDFSAPAEGPLAATFSELFSDVFRQAAADATTPGRGADIELGLQVSFVDAMRGAQMPISLTRQDRCVPCGGSGHVSRAESSCPACAGKGVRRWARGHMVFSKECDACAGLGRLATAPCGPCRGLGIGVRHEVVTLTIPAGVESGGRISVPGHGHAGVLGGPAGDLYFTIEVSGHPYFRRDGADVHVTVPVQVHEAALGAIVEVPTLDGSVSMQVPAGTISGQRLRLGSHRVGDSGEPAQTIGDLYAEIQIVLPPMLDERSKELLREFGRRNSFDVRRDRYEQR